MPLLLQGSRKRASFKHLPLRMRGVEAPMLMIPLGAEANTEASDTRRLCYGFSEPRHTNRVCVCVNPQKDKEEELAVLVTLSTVSSREWKDR